jgi:hypothetical protein
MICFRSQTVQTPGFFKQCNAIMPPFKLLPRRLPMFEMHQELFDQQVGPRGCGWRILQRRKPACGAQFPASTLQDSPCRRCAVKATLKERLFNIFCGEEFLEKKSV